MHPRDGKQDPIRNMERRKPRWVSTTTFPHHPAHLCGHVVTMETVLIGTFTSCDQSWWQEEQSCQCRRHFRSRMWNGDNLMSFSFVQNHSHFLGETSKFETFSQRLFFTVCSPSLRRAHGEKLAFVRLTVAEVPVQVAQVLFSCKMVSGTTVASPAAASVTPTAAEERN